MKILAEILILSINLICWKIWILPIMLAAISLGVPAGWHPFVLGIAIGSYYGVCFDRVRRHCLKKMWEPP